MTDFPKLDFHDFHLQQLPRQLAVGHGLLAAQAARELAAICFRLKDSDHAYTFQPMAETIAIVAGTEAEQVVELDQSQWQAMIYHFKSSPELLSAGHISQTDDNSIVPHRWQSVLRAMLYGS